LAPCHPSGEPIHALKQDEARKIPRCTQGLAPTNVVEDKEVCPHDLVWREVYEDGMPTAEGGADDVQTRLATLAVENDGALVLGPPGTGKSVLIRLAVALIRQRESDAHITVAALTHAAARVAKGRTLAYVLRKNPRPGQWFVIDECSFPPVSMWGEFCRWQLMGTRFLIVGDIQGQIAPIFDRWYDAGWEERFERSQLLHGLVKGMVIHLTTYRRGDSPELFDWYKSLYEPSCPPVQVMVPEAAAKFPWTQQGDIYLVKSHRKRLLVNDAMNQHMAHTVPEENRLFLPKPEDRRRSRTMEQQDMYLWPGLELVGAPRAVAGAKQVLKSVVYVVTGFDRAACTVDLEMHRDWRLSRPRAGGEDVDEGEPGEGGGGGAG